MFPCLNCKNAGLKVLKPISDSPFNYFDCVLCSKTNYHLRCSCEDDILSLDPFFFGKKMFCKKCNKYLNIVPCPKCKQMNMWNGNYKMGSNIICLACKNSFQQVACPSCYESIYWNVDYQKNCFYKDGVNLQCNKCSQSFQHLTCPCCFSPVYFKECNLMWGKGFRCNTCKTDLFHVKCKKCSFSEVFKSDDNLMFGKKSSCRNCKAFYTIFPCLTCNNAANILLPDSQNIILKFSCTSKTCKEFYIYKCSHCPIFSFFLPHSSGCTKEICKSCKKTNPIYYCTQCKTEKFCECSINNEAKHECTSCKKELANIPKGNLDSNNDGFCIVDMTRKVDTVFVPCGHACYCSLCYGKLLAQGKPICPMCNEKRECIKLHL